MTAYGSAWQGCSKCHSRTPCKCLQDTPHERALKADAERLAELREELVTQQARAEEKWDLLNRTDDSYAAKAAGVEYGAAMERIGAVKSLIAVYEECAARGIAFGGGR